MSALDRPYSVGKGRALRRRALTVVYTFGLFSAVAAAIIALRVAAFLPDFPN
jgi:hypothetical protein